MTSDSRGIEHRRLEELFDLGEPTADWAEADLAAMLRHQLAQPLPPPFDRPAESGANPHTRSGAARTIRDLLEQPSPQVESLQALKHLSKARRARSESAHPGDGGGAVPPDLWRVLYFASIAAALRSDQRISELSPSELLQGFRWTLSRPWLDASIRRLVEQARDKFDESAR